LKFFIFCSFQKYNIKFISESLKKKLFETIFEYYHEDIPKLEDLFGSVNLLVSIRHENALEKSVHELLKK
jgi:hypothetical protein